MTNQTLANTGISLVEKHADELANHLNTNGIDWENFDVYDVEFRIGARYDRTLRRTVKQLRSVQVMITFGGPNSYIDTDKNSLEVYWGFNHVSRPLDKYLCEKVNEHFDWIEDV